MIKNEIAGPITSPTITNITSRPTKKTRPGVNENNNFDNNENQDFAQTNQNQYEAEEQRLENSKPLINQRDRTRRPLEKRKGKSLKQRIEKAKATLRRLNDEIYNIIQDDILDDNLGSTTKASQKSLQ